VEPWDAADFGPWETLRWETVRVIRYWQPKPDRTGVEAYWLTDFSPMQADSQVIYRHTEYRRVPKLLASPLTRA